MQFLCSQSCETSHCAQGKSLHFIVFKAQRYLASGFLPDPMSLFPLFTPGTLACSLFLKCTRPAHALYPSWNALPLDVPLAHSTGPPRGTIYVQHIHNMLEISWPTLPLLIGKNWGTEKLNDFPRISHKEDTGKRNNVSWSLHYKTCISE